MRGEAQVELRRDTLRAHAHRPAAKMLVSEEDEPLLSALKAKRRALAEAARVPAYVVFNDKTLIEMAEKRPVDLDQMAGIGGVGAKKLESYGRAFLDVIAGAVADMHPARRKLAGRAAGTLFDMLQATAGQLARGEDGAGKYMTLTATTLRPIAERKPATIDELARVSGMTASKSERFGPAFLEILTEGN